MTGRTARTRLVAAIAAAVLVGPSTAATAAILTDEQRARLELGGRLGPEVVEILDRDGLARVVVTFAVPSAAGARRTSFGSGEARADLRRAADELLAAIAGGDFRLVHRYRWVNALAGVVRPEGALALADHPLVTAIGADLPQRAQLPQAGPLIGVPGLRDLGLRGRGVTVAVLDTGVDFQHPALRRARRAERCFCSKDDGCCPNGGASQEGEGAAADEEGHGTHVAGIVASRGKGGAPRGVASRAKLVAVRVLNAAGSGFVSDALAGLDWLLDERPDVDIVNMSLGTNPFKAPCDHRGHGLGEIYASLIGNLVERGVMVFASSGNDAKRRKMGMPACIDQVISVGASYDEDFSGFLFTYQECVDISPSPPDLTCFTNSPRQLDLAAPGIIITSAALERGSVDSGGTSQASPMAAGCAALLREAFPQATPAEVESALEGSGEVATDPKTGRDYPRLDCLDALALLSSP